MFAAPQGLSQRTTSFIASQRQGIHRTPFWHLIALVINAHAARPSAEARRTLQPTGLKPIGQSRIDQRPCFILPGNERGRIRSHWLAVRAALHKDRSTHSGQASSSQCLTSHAPTRIRATTAQKLSLPRKPCSGQNRPLPTTPQPERLVEPDGIEPTTSCLQSTRSPN